MSIWQQFCCWRNYQCRRFDTVRLGYPAIDITIGVLLTDEDSNELTDENGNQLIEG